MHMHMGVMISSDGSVKLGYIGLRMHYVGLLILYLLLMLIDWRKVSSYLMYMMAFEFTSAVKWEQLLRAYNIIYVHVLNSCKQQRSNVTGNHNTACLLFIILYNNVMQLSMNEFEIRS